MINFWLTTSSIESFRVSHLSTQIQLHQMFICNCHLSSWLLQVVVDAESRASYTQQRTRRLIKSQKKYLKILL
ncbi:hypothetical protein X975_15940, partial [Stegodyphus mimosarum]